MRGEPSGETLKSNNSPLTVTQLTAQVPSRAADARTEPVREEGSPVCSGLGAALQLKTGVSPGASRGVAAGDLGQRAACTARLTAALCPGLLTRPTPGLEPPAHTWSRSPQAGWAASPGPRLAFCGAMAALPPAYLCSGSAGLETV